MIFEVFAVECFSEGLSIPGFDLRCRYSSSTSTTKQRDVPVGSCKNIQASERVADGEGDAEKDGTEHPACVRVYVMPFGICLRVLSFRFPIVVDVKAEADPSDAHGGCCGAACCEARLPGVEGEQEH